MLATLSCHPSISSSNNHNQHEIIKTNKCTDRWDQKHSLGNFTLLESVSFYIPDQITFCQIVDLSFKGTPRCLNCVFLLLVMYPVHHYFISCPPRPMMSGRPKALFSYFDVVLPALHSQKDAFKNITL